MGSFPETHNNPPILLYKTIQFINPVHSLVLETLGSKLSMYVFFFCNSSLATLSLSLQDMRNILLKNLDAEVQGDWDKVFLPPPFLVSTQAD